MARYTLEQYRAVVQRRITALKKAGIKSSREAAELMANIACKLAPRKSGETISGISIRKEKDAYIVVSSVPGTFKQNLFANQTAPFRTINYPKGAWIPPKRSYTGKWTKVAEAGTKALYGISPSHWTWTGTPRFFHFATLRTSEIFSQIIRRNTREALRVGLGG